MNIHPKHCFALLLITLGLLPPVAVAQAQSRNQLTLVAGTVSSGGAASASQYRLRSVARQAGAGIASGGQYVITSGFLADQDPPPADSTIYLPLVRR